MVYAEQSDLQASVTDLFFNTKPKEPTIALESPTLEHIQGTRRAIDSTRTLGKDSEEENKTV